MSSLEDISVKEPQRNRFEVTLDYYLIGLSVLLMVLGLRQWAVIVGMLEGSAGTFEAMSQQWQIATMHLAVVDLVAAVGLWMRVAWGRVVWILAAVSEIAFHTLFIGTFGSNLLAVLFHCTALLVFAGLYLLANRAPRHE